MDLEGGEHAVLPGLEEWEGRIDILVVEFGEDPHDSARFNPILRALPRLPVLVHLHGDNPQPRTADGLPGMVEITLLAPEGVRAAPEGVRAAPECVRAAPEGVRAAPFSDPITARDRRSSLRSPGLSFTASSAKTARSDALSPSRFG